jgi:DNA modification methylase
MSILTNRNYMGSEISQEYVDICDERLEKYIKANLDSTN